MTPDKLREKGNRWRELGQYDLANIYNQHAAALEEIERLKVLTADLEKEGARAIYTAVQQSERAEKAEAERDALKRHAEEVKRDLAASVVKSAELEEENSKLRSALAIVHFKREPWQ